MKYQVRYSDRALEQIKPLRAYDRAAILAKINHVLTTVPMKTSKTAIKLLEQPAPAQYRLRVGNYRVFYNVEGDVVRIVEIMTKEDSIMFLRRHP